MSQPSVPLPAGCHEQASLDSQTTASGKLRLMIVGAGWEQLPIIQAALARGYEVVAADGHPQASGLLIQSNHLTPLILSTRDAEGVLQAARDHAVHGITYMITESSMESIHHATHALNLPGPSRESVEATVSKTRMREIFAENGLANAQYRRVRTPEAAVTACKELELPLVMKPADRSGQLGLHRITDISQITAAFEDSVSFSPTHEVIIEEWLDGPELNGVGIVLGGKLVALTLSDREKHPTEAFGIVQRHVYPSLCSGDEIDETGRLCAEAVRVLKIQNGIIFPQIIVTRRGPVMAEFGERIPGGIMKELFEYATGYDLVELQIDIALGRIQPLEHYRTKPVNKSVVVKFLNCYSGGPLKPGKVSKTLHLEEVRQLPGILEAQFFLNADRPQEIKELKRAADRFFFLVAGGSSRDEAVRRSEDAANLIDFLDSRGQSLKTQTSPPSNG